MIPMVSRRLRWALAAILLSLALVVFLLRSQGPTFRPMRHGQEIVAGWTAVVTEGAPGAMERYRYGIRNPAGKVFPLLALSFDSMSVGTLGSPQGAVIVTRYDGEGSSGATYYSFYRVTSAGLVALSASEVRDWGPEEPCRERPQIQAPAPRHTTVFGACPAPRWSKDHAVFALPGFHCSRWQTGGCRMEHVVRWH